MDEICGLPIRIIRSKRKTVSIEIKVSEILVRVPYRMSLKAIDAIICEKDGLIKKHISAIREKRQQINELTPFSEEEIKALVKKAKSVIPKKVKHYAPIVGVDYERIFIRTQRTRWGSCSLKKNLNFNCILMLFPDEVIDSVIVHELCHLKHMNHSPAFYAEVERVFPDYKKCRKWLKENGGMYLCRIP